MLPTKIVLSRLIESLYHAASDSDLWGNFLADVAALTNASSAALLVHDSLDNQHNVVMQFGFDPQDLSRYYNQRNDIIDIWTKKALAISHTGWTGVSESLAPPSELVASAFYNETLRNLNVYYGMFGVIQQDGPILANIALYRPPTRSPFSPSNMHLLQFLMPHLRIAFQLHFRLADLRQKGALLNEAADLVPSAMFFIDSAGKIVFMNRSASRILALRDGLIVVRNELRAVRPEESMNLKELIRRALAASFGGVHPAGAMLISRKSQSPLQVLVSPLTNANDGIPEGAAAVAFVVDPTQRISSRSESLRALFGLTRAECRVAVLLADGKSLVEVSEEIGVRRNTVKTQIASIYAKTGTSQQSQVVRLVLQIPR